eukprot:CAMPEP_0185618312 /NCGR_PEP_ID=MMETSP0436-20130131/46590_1 /TAXON_ID=626734 ORGANISM="Favella taraikaensis, Strain Fe Narragansett Bay" /NCGR_SAMPLE_ID=MMETSP0436 /ASSEMBLY_ACC=CAM_ASM_000390 /LENGTH=90 /DNA_ID=CAMNT_0028256797 /DNA_START=135 /DNA_END=404 /DNA_ORIENTATION=-
MNALSVMSGLFTISNFKKYGQLNGLTNEDYLAWVGSIAALLMSNKWVWSLGTDHFSYKAVYTLQLSLQIALDFTMPLVAKHKVLFAIWVA